MQVYQNQSMQDFFVLLVKCKKKINVKTFTMIRGQKFYEITQIWWAQGIMNDIKTE